MCVLRNKTILPNHSLQANYNFFVCLCVHLTRLTKENYKEPEGHLGSLNKAAL